MWIRNKEPRQLNEKIFIVSLRAFFSHSVLWTDVEDEVSSVVSVDDQLCYWEKILSSDQAYRNGSFNHYMTECIVEVQSDKSKVDSIDCLNMKRVLLMLDKHGFPKIEDFPPHVHSTPSVVFIHQKSVELRVHYFPVLYSFYRSGDCPLHEINYVLGSIYFNRFQERVSIENDEEMNHFIKVLQIEEDKVDFDPSAILNLCNQ